MTPATFAVKVTGVPADGLVGLIESETVGVACGTVIVAVWGV